jgi:hypothetical protein
MRIFLVTGCSSLWDGNYIDGVPLDAERIYSNSGGANANENPAAATLVRIQGVLVKENCRSFS